MNQKTKKNKYIVFVPFVWFYIAFSIIHVLMCILQIFLRMPFWKCWKEVKVVDEEVVIETID